MLRGYYVGDKAHALSLIMRIEGAVTDITGWTFALTLKTITGTTVFTSNVTAGDTPSDDLAAGLVYMDMPAIGEIPSALYDLQIVRTIPAVDSKDVFPASLSAESACFTQAECRFIVDEVGGLMNLSAATLNDVVDWTVYPRADSITVDASGFVGQLSATDTNVQIALDSLDGHSHGLSANELTQLANIDTTAITTQQWGWLGALDQSIKSASNVQFSNVAVGVPTVGNGIDVGINKYVGFYPTVSHQTGSAGQIGVAINDGGGLCGAFVANTHDGTYSSQSFNVKTAKGGVSVATQCIEADSLQNVSIGKASLSTTATDGFAYIPSCAGTPTGTPTLKTGFAPLVIDSSNNILYAYIGGAWRAMN